MRSLPQFCRIGKNTHTGKTVMSWVKLSQSFHLFSFLDVFKRHIVNQLKDLNLTVSSQHKHFNHLATKPIRCFLSVWVRDYCFHYLPLLFTILCATLLPDWTLLVYIYIYAVMPVPIAALWKPLICWCLMHSFPSSPVLLGKCSPSDTSIDINCKVLWK